MNSALSSRDVWYYRDTLLPLTAKQSLAQTCISSVRRRVLAGIVDFLGRATISYEIVLQVAYVRYIVRAARSLPTVRMT